MKLLRIDSLAELRQNAERWDELWRRSDVTLPTARAEMVAQWVEHFAPKRRFVALAVEKAGELLAAIPLVDGPNRTGRFMAQLPRNCWTDAGDILVEPSDSGIKAVGLLATALGQLPWSMICVDGAPAESPRWQTLLKTLHDRQCRFVIRPKFHVGVIDIRGHWDLYEASLSTNHRHALRKTLRKLRAEPAGNIVALNNPSAEDVPALLQRVCAIEDKSWKGTSGSSIMQTPGMFEFFLRQAIQLAKWGQVEFTFLRQDDQDLAAEYAYVAKGVLHSHKIAYDPQHRELGPFRLLRYLQLQEIFEHESYEAVDTLGIMSEANARWSTRSYIANRIVCSTGGLLGNFLVDKYERVWPKLKSRLGRSVETPAAEKLGASRYLNTVADLANDGNQREIDATHSFQQASPC